MNQSPPESERSLTHTPTGGAIPVAERTRGLPLRSAFARALDLYSYPGPSAKVAFWFQSMSAARRELLILTRRPVCRRRRAARAR
jgi:hypothetical protein